MEQVKMTLTAPHAVTVVPANTPPLPVPAQRTRRAKLAPPTASPVLVQLPTNARAVKRAFNSRMTAVVSAPVRLTVVLDHILGMGSALPAIPLATAAQVPVTWNVSTVRRA